MFDIEIPSTALIIAFLAFLAAVPGAEAGVVEAQPFGPAGHTGCEVCPPGPGSSVIPTLTDLGPGHPSPGKSAICIVDPGTGQDLGLPYGSWGIFELLPAKKGYTMLFHRLPSGDLEVEYLGYVYPGHVYRYRFCAGVPGSHELWYRVGWVESNRIRFHVMKLC